MNRILGIGNALVDIIIKLEDEELLKEFILPKGSMQLVDKNLANKIEAYARGIEMKITSGGSAANTIHGLSKLGIKTGFIGKTGNDAHGDFFKKDMQQTAIEPYISYGIEETGRAITLVTPDTERTFATYLGSAIELNVSDIDESQLNNFEVIHIEGYLVQNHNLVEKVLELAFKNKMYISIDLASFNVVETNLEFLKKNILKYVNIVFANEEEARAFTGENAEKAVREISLMCETAVVKIGNKGSVIRKGQDEYIVGIVNAEPIDTTGAGDLYASGFLYGLSKGFNLSKCGSIGALLAGRVIEVLGAKIPSKDWDQIRNQVKEII